jgi:hypothetical protein
VTAPVPGEAQLDALRSCSPGSASREHRRPRRRTQRGHRSDRREPGGKAGRSLQVAVTGGAVTVRAVGGDRIEL